MSATKQKTPVIYDGDMGGDDLWALALLYSKKYNIDLLGITTVFGNTNVDQATQNALDWTANYLDMTVKEGDKYTFNVSQDKLIAPVYKGSAHSLDAYKGIDDDAYGKNGLGEAFLKKSKHTAESIDAVQFIKEQLIEAQNRLDTNRFSKPLTIFSTGPATNIARALIEIHRNEKIKVSNKAFRIIAMAGALEPKVNGECVIDGRSNEPKQGNVTPYAEFNAYKDPHALNYLIERGVDLTFVPLDVCHDLVMTPEKEALFDNGTDKRKQMLGMLSSAKELDSKGWGVDGAFVYDPHTVLYFSRPDWFVTKSVDKLHFVAPEFNVVSGAYYRDGSPCVEHPEPQDRRGQMIVNDEHQGRIAGNVMIVTGLRSVQGGEMSGTTLFNHMKMCI